MNRSFTVSVYASIYMCLSGAEAAEAAEEAAEAANARRKQAKGKGLAGAAAAAAAAASSEPTIAPPSAGRRAKKVIQYEEDEKITAIFDSGE